MKSRALERYRKNFCSPFFPEVLVPRRICNQRSNGNQGTDSNDVSDDDDDEDDGGDDEKDDVVESSLSRAKPIFSSDIEENGIGYGYFFRPILTTTFFRESTPHSTRRFSSKHGRAVDDHISLCLSVCLSFYRYFTI